MCDCSCIFLASVAPLKAGKYRNNSATAPKSWTPARPNTSTIDVDLRIMNGDRSQRERSIAMKAPCTLTRMRNGQWLVRHSSHALGTVEVSAGVREEALTKMRNELQYRIELCPCSGVSGDTVELQVREAGGRP